MLIIVNKKNENGVLHRILRHLIVCIVDWSDLSLFQQSDVGQISILLCIIKSISDHERIWDLKTDIVDSDRYLALRGFVKECADLNSFRVQRSEVFRKKLQCVSSINNILNDEDVLVFKIIAAPADELDP